MTSRSRAGKWKRRLRIAAAGLFVATIVAIPVWQSVQAQAPPSGTQLELVNEDGD